MPVCPNCKYESIEGITICPECKTPLSKAYELKNYEELSGEDWVLVYTSFNEIEADMIREHLESAGISVSILSQRDSNFPAPGNLSTIKIFVRKADVAEALEFIQNLKSGFEEDEDNDED